MLYQEHWNGSEVNELHTIKIAFLDHLESCEAYEKRVLSICTPDFPPTAFLCKKKVYVVTLSLLFPGLNLGYFILFQMLTKFQCVNETYSWAE
jgi:hypothetical protein